MFEKEAKEYTHTKHCEKCGTGHCEKKCILVKDDYETFKDGAEFGYNKANEWHYVKDGDLPKKVDDYVTNIGILTYDSYGNGVYKWHTPHCRACDYADVVEDDEVIAWCEIPKYTEE